MSDIFDIQTLLKKPVSELLPHSAPMVLIDHIDKMEEQCIQCTASYQNNGFFQNDSGVPATWAVEIIAQACALFVSIRQYGTGITQGRLLKCRSFEFPNPTLPYDTTFTIEARLKLAGDSGLWMFEGSMMDENNRIWASGDMSILVT